MASPAIRRAVAADLPRLVALLNDDAIGRQREDARQPPHPRYAEAFAAIEEDRNQLLAVAESGGDVVGCLQITFLPGLTYTGSWRGQIEGVRIASEYRGKNLGRHLVAWAIDRCLERGCVLVQLTSDKRRDRAVRFYEDLGFVASHEGMKLRLTVEASP